MFHVTCVFFHGQKTLYNYRLHYHLHLWLMGGVHWLRFDPSGFLPSHLMWKYIMCILVINAFFLFFFQVDEVDENLLTQLAYNARGDICPMQGVIGGITAQEVMKVWPCMHTAYAWKWFWSLEGMFHCVGLPWHSVTATIILVQSTERSVVAQPVIVISFNPKKLSKMYIMFFVQ